VSKDAADRLAQLQKLRPKSTGNLEATRAAGRWKWDTKRGERNAHGQNVRPASNCRKRSDALWTFWSTLAWNHNKNAPKGALYAVGIQRRIRSRVQSTPAAHLPAERLLTGDNQPLRRKPRCLAVLRQARIATTRGTCHPPPQKNPLFPFFLPNTEPPQESQLKIIGCSALTGSGTIGAIGYPDPESRNFEVLLKAVSQLRPVSTEQTPLKKFDTSQRLSA